MSPTEITRLSKWAQFILFVISLIGQAIKAFPTLISRIVRKGTDRSV